MYILTISQTHVHTERKKTKKNKTNNLTKLTAISLNEALISEDLDSYTDRLCVM